MKSTAQQILESAPRRFRPEKAQNFNTTFHFIITGDEALQYSLIIADGTCTLHKELTGTPDCVIKTKAQTYIALETGQANPQMALMTGKVSVSNIGAMMQFAKCFRKFDESYVTNAPTQQLPESKQRNPRKGPLHGVTILDFTRLLPGPLATMMLADMGADVIKIEDPDSPDYIRDFEPMLGSTSAFYYALNRNKRSLSVNFLSPEGKALIIELVKKADVLLEQYRPGVMKNFGLDYDTLKAINPKLVYVSITGYGQQSSLSQAAGHDLNYIATAGLLGITGTIDEPVIPGFQVADIAGGSYSAISAVTAALFQRERTGSGDHIDIAMTDCILPFMALPFAAQQATGMGAERGKFQLSGSLANYNIYACADGKHIAMGALEPKFWNKVCERLGKPEWRDKIIGNEATQNELKAALRDLFKQKTRSEWIQFFGTDDVCISAVNDIDEVANDPYLIEKNAYINFDIEGRSFKTIAQPIRFKSMTKTDNWLAPALGEDTLAILRSLHISDEKILELTQKNVIKTG
jgi:crotonobetainyl-CoA:carnitine CoA-transferase CaiB-like acyl-CoA transferase/putative sterol carrier protein